MTARIVYTFRPEHYDAIKAMVADKAWPRTFAEWDEAAREATDKAVARGEVVKQVVIDPKQFAAYCLGAGLEHNEASLGAFATVMARDQLERGQ